MCLGAEMKVRRDRVLKELYQEVTAKQQSHRANDRMSRTDTLVACCPDSDRFREYFNEDCCQHESGAKSYEILEEALSESVRAPFDQQQPTYQIR
jgi:hypothetical protein